MAQKNSVGKTMVWIILGLLILGLGGFGVTGLGGTVRKVGTVGDQVITVDEYVRELRQEIRATEAQIGQTLTMEQARLFGIDQQALGRLVALAAFDDEVARIGISVGDENVRRELLDISAFQGIDGKFDPEAYRFALEQVGLSDAEFEADLRAEAARTLVQGAIVAGVPMPETFTETLAQYVGERRSFTFASLTAEDLPEPIAEPDEADLKAYYDAHPDAFRLPETKKITYVLLTPEMLLDKVDIDEDAVRTLYNDRADQYHIPERRLVERLAFGDEAAATTAKAQLDVNGTTFEQLVTGRGLALADVDMGDVTAEDLGEAAEAIFAAATGDVVGPLPSPVGPALYRVNGVLAERITTFEDARQELSDELATERARRDIDAQIAPTDDLLAGGATLEEVAQETDAQLGQIDWSVNSTDGVAAYDAFRTAAAAATAEDYPAVDSLDDGGLFALRVDEILPERAEPFEEARPQVIAAWTAAETAKALEAMASAAILKLAETGSFEDAGLTVRVENGLTRRAFIDGTGADFMNQVFEMEPDSVRVIASGQSAQIVRLDAIAPPEDNSEIAAFRTSIQRELDQALSQALFQSFLSDVQSRANPQIDQNALNAVMASFR